MDSRLKLRGKSAPKKKKGPPGMNDKAYGEGQWLTNLQLPLARSDKLNETHNDASDVDDGGPEGSSRTSQEMNVWIYTRLLARSRGEDGAGKMLTFPLWFFIQVCKTICTITQNTSAYDLNAKTLRDC